MSAGRSVMQTEYEKWLADRGVTFGGNQWTRDWDVREKGVKEFAWAIPNVEALVCIHDVMKRRRVPRLLELGAGSGYWAYELERLGGKVSKLDITCYDLPHQDEFDAAGRRAGYYHFTKQWYHVRRPKSPLVQQSRLMAAHNSALMLGWPNYASPFADHSLRDFTGNTFIYIGEGPYGCTGDDKFHARVNREWRRIETVDIPQFSGIHDYMSVYARKGT
jgi:hypothetical protein